MCWFHPETLYAQLLKVLVMDVSNFKQFWVWIDVGLGLIGSCGEARFGKFSKDLWFTLRSVEGDDVHHKFQNSEKFQESTAEDAKQYCL